VTLCGAAVNATCARDAVDGTMAIWTNATDAMAALAQQAGTLTLFPYLGSDCVLHVLRSLPIYDALQLATVSSDWRSAANSRLAEETKLDLSCTAAPIDSSLVSWLLGRMPRVNNIDLTDCVGVTLSAATGTVYSMMSRLQRIDVSGTAIDAQSFFDLWSLPEIYALAVSGCPRLVEMEMCQHARPPSSSLRNLSLARCPRLTGQASVSCLARLAPDLRALDVSGYETMPAAVVSVIAHSCRKLFEIHLAECEQLDDAAVSQLASNCRDLEEVQLSWCSEITEMAVHALTQKCKYLRVVDLRCCTSVYALRAAGFLGSSSSTLTELNLNRCECDGPPVNWTLSALFRCRELRVLDLGWLTDLVNDTHLKYLIWNLDALERLSLEGCKRLTNAGIVWLELALRNRNTVWRKEARLPPQWTAVDHRNATLDDGRPSDACSELIRSTDVELLPREPRACMLKYLDLSYVDYVSQDALAAVLRASCGVNDLRVKDYYGEEWRVSRGSGEPTRCAAANEPRSAPDSPR
jgi:hypothetical protein